MDSPYSPTWHEVFELERRLREILLDSGINEKLAHAMLASQTPMSWISATQRNRRKTSNMPDFYADRVPRMALQGLRIELHGSKLVRGHERAPAVSANEESPCK